MLKKGSVFKFKEAAKIVANEINEMFVFCSALFGARLGFSPRELIASKYFANKTKGLLVGSPKYCAERVKFRTEHGKKRLENVDTPVWSGRLFVFFDQGPSLAGYILGRLEGWL